MREFIETSISGLSNKDKKEVCKNCNHTKISHNYGKTCCKVLYCDCGKYTPELNIIEKLNKIAKNETMDNTVSLKQAKELLDILNHEAN